MDKHKYFTLLPLELQSFLQDLFATPRGADQMVRKVFTNISDTSTAFSLDITLLFGGGPDDVVTVIGDSIQPYDCRMGITCTGDMVTDALYERVIQAVTCAYVHVVAESVIARQVKLEDCALTTFLIQTALGEQGPQTCIHLSIASKSCHQMVELVYDHRGYSINSESFCGSASYTHIDLDIRDAVTRIFQRVRMQALVYRVSTVIGDMIPGSAVVWGVDGESKPDSLTSLPIRFEVLKEGFSVSVTLDTAMGNYCNALCIQGREIVVAAPALCTKADLHKLLEPIFNRIGWLQSGPIPDSIGSKVGFLDYRAIDPKTLLGELD
jgi:hypothetical protein